MSKILLNNYAVEVFKKAFKDKGFMIEDSTYLTGMVNFIVSKNNRKLKIKVKAMSQMGSYVFIEKTKFNISDPDIFMAFLYAPNKQDEILYLIPAVDWDKNIYPLKGKDYVGLKSEPEWGINYSQKSKEALGSYKFSIMIDKLI